MNLIDDEIVSAQIVKEADQLLVVCESGSMKRVKCNEIIVLGRPVKGNLIHKKVKSNPAYIRYTKAVNANDKLCFIDTEVHEIEAKEIAIMNRESTFSNPIKLENTFYLVKGLEIVEKKAKIEKKDTKIEREKVEEIHFDF